MKQGVHPEFYKSAKVTCTSCKAVFLIPGTVKEQHIEICSNCHPVYTGEFRGVLTSGRVEKFQKRLAAATLRQAQGKSKAWKKMKLTPEEKLERKLEVKRAEKKTKKESKKKTKK